MKRRPRISWKQKADPQSRLHGAHPQPGAMQVGDSADQAEAEAVAGSRPAAFSAVEAVREARQVARRDARSIILDRKKDAGFGTVGQPQTDECARWCMAQRVLHQVCESLRQEFLVAAHADAWRDRRIQLMARLLCVQPIRVKNGLRNGG